MQGRVLIVNAEPETRGVLRSALKDAGYEVGETRTGGAAVHLARASRYDLILLEVNTPIAGGLGICQKIRASTEAPIIIISALAEETDKIAALDAGADDYVMKPFSTREVLARIRAVLRRTALNRDERAPMVVFAGMEINFSARKLIVKGKDVRLTPKEFDLLHYLATNANLPLSHGKILQAVWGPDYGEEVEYLRVLIKQLRKKIEPDPVAPKYIVTEHWFGYRFRLPEADQGEARLPVDSTNEDRRVI